MVNKAQVAVVVLLGIMAVFVSVVPVISYRVGYEDGVQDVYNLYDKDKEDFELNYDKFVPNHYNSGNFDFVYTVPVGARINTGH